MLLGICEHIGLVLDGATLALVKQSPRITVFMFHSVSESARAGSETPRHRPDVFECFVEWLARRCVVKGSVDADGRWAGGDQLRNCAAVLTFDDGFLDHYTTVYRLLQKYQMTGTFFLPTDLIGRTGGLTRSMVREMSDGGMVIGSHSASHCVLSQCGPAALHRELNESKAYLEDLTGRVCETLAYPYGHYNELVKDMALRVGYKQAFAATPSASMSDRFAMPRIGIPDTLQTWKYAAALYDAGRWRRFVGRNEMLDRFVHGTLGYNSARLHWPPVHR
jgi:peptidoglycan/xylan/chitin deacetylase (PgdA/CDA1 family)